jgi:hypothetical protein
MVARRPLLAVLAHALAFLAICAAAWLHPGHAARRTEGPSARERAARSAATLGSSQATPEAAVARAARPRARLVTGALLSGAPAALGGVAPVTARTAAPSSYRAAELAASAHRQDARGPPAG